MMNRAKILALGPELDQLNLSTERGGKHVRITGQQPVEHEQKGTAAPTGVGKSERFG